jgi:hypothetical protein
MNDNVNAAQLRTALQLTRAVAMTIHDMGEAGAPGGILYAAVMGKMDLPAFESMMTTIIKTGLVQKRGQVYFWVGPTTIGERT